MGVGDLLKKIFIESERSDSGVIELLYRWYGRKVYHAAYYVLNDRYLAEDIAQETFLTAMSKLDTLRDPTKVEAWLVRTAINKSYEALRKHRRIAVLEEAATSLEGDTALDHLLDDELKREVLDALHLLPAINREVVYHKFYCERGCHEISEILEIPERTVRARLKRALELVADYLGREVDDTGAAGKEAGKNYRRGY